ncbi:acetate--CoA ligase family protein [Achromobacter sp. SD115]|uniref:acetate--CoA ligase family protein n=1 Tax=Achromobacter sp. SD115 TaxID=2782011 RepID=UPI001A95B0E9|nr:acetate--CoA ligase family protein [Achromobacter sp. SD115]MBO1018337.1 acetate--CoA ligase family protein [Achromobacter sp. SD115]
MKPFADLTRFTNPRNIAVVGASARESSQGRRLYDNLVLHSSVPGEVYAVNPAYQEIGGRRCWPSISALPEAEIDVALIMINASLVLDSLRQCAARGIPFAVVMTSGFSEAGEEGQRLEREIAQLCETTGLHVYGPNCPGFVNVRDRLGMTFSPAFKDDLNSGSIGLATQGGGLGRNLLQGLSFGQGVGLWFSAGNEVDLEIPDFIAHMANDPKTSVIALLMEGVKNGRRLTAALELARTRNKPVVVLKVGRSEAGVRAAQSHTASVAGTAAVNSAVFRQFGAIEVDDLDQLLAVSRLLTRITPKSGNGLCIYTFSGGTAALAADIAGAAGLPMAVFAPETKAALRKLLPDFASMDNPVDTTADILRNPEASAACLRAICADPALGTVLFPIPMDYGGITDGMAQAIATVAAETDTLIVPVWMSRRLGGGFQLLETAGLLPFLSLSDAIAALSKAIPWQRPEGVTAAAPRHEQGTAGQARMLSEAAAKSLLREAGLPIPEGLVVASAGQAAREAERLGFPVVMKVVSAQIAHKTEAGGVKLGIASADAAREAYATIHESVARHSPDAIIDGILVERMLPPGGREVLVGVHRDAAFGLVLTFGLGGIFVETIRDVAHRMVPLSRDDARALLREIRYAEVLDGVRGQPPADLAALEDLILRVSDFAWSHRDALQELELNPVWVGAEGQGATPLDALIGLRPDAEPGLMQRRP